MLACSDVEEGGGALMVLPGSVQLAKAAVAEMRSRLGDEAYHSREWRGEIGKAIAEEHGQRGVEVHPRDGDLVIFVRLYPDLECPPPKPQSGLSAVEVSAGCSVSTSVCVSSMHPTRLWVAGLDGATLGIAVPQRPAALCLVQHVL